MSRRNLQDPFILHLKFVGPGGTSVEMISPVLPWHRRSGSVLRVMQPALLTPMLLMPVASSSAAIVTSVSHVPSPSALVASAFEASSVPVTKSVLREEFLAPPSTAIALGKAMLQLLRVSGRRERDAPVPPGLQIRDARVHVPAPLALELPAAVVPAVTAASVRLLLPLATVGPTILLLLVPPSPAVVLPPILSRPALFAVAAAARPLSTAASTSRRLLTIVIP